MGRALRVRGRDRANTANDRPQLSPIEAIGYQGKVVAATRRASRLNPTNAPLHARLAEASAAISMYRDAASEAEEALRLDRITPHLDKKLPDRVGAARSPPTGLERTSGAKPQSEWQSLTDWLRISQASQSRVELTR